MVAHVGPRALCQDMTLESQRIMDQNPILLEEQVDGQWPQDVATSGRCHQKRPERGEVLHEKGNPKLET